MAIFHMSIRLITQVLPFLCFYLYWITSQVCHILGESLSAEVQGLLLAFLSGIYELRHITALPLYSGLLTGIENVPVRTPGMYILALFKHVCVNKWQRMRRCKFIMLRTSDLSNSGMLFQYHSLQILAVIHKCALTVENIWKINLSQ